jgi:UDP-N-acetylmuramoyl-tripeptide--D-alanyl-D-alanine ligase
LPAARQAKWASTSDDIEDALVATVRGGDVVMIKGSLGSRMAPLVNALIRSGEKDCIEADRGA